MRFIRYKKTTREKIKEATFDMLAEKGYKDLTMRDIAKRAGAAVGQLTYYYRTKETLVHTVLEEILTGLAAELKAKVSKSSNKIKSLLEYYNDCCEQEPELAKVLLNFMTESLWNNDIKEILTHYTVDVTKLIENIYLEQGLEQGEAIIKANFMMSSISGIMAHQILKGEPLSKHGEYQKILLSI
ncbi:MAG: TetR/AcrR family transcriptional regulator [Clostridia bacterium]|nr:TetR/AcrR family transcriptional regulator [Clostridia bacterium]